jgi:hypothetical protein
LEFWLRRAFLEEDRALDASGSPRNAAILKLVGQIIQTTGSIGQWQPDPDLWLHDPDVFKTTMAHINFVMDRFRPAGEASAGRFTSADVDALLEEVSNASLAAPLGKKGNREVALAVLKEQLGELLESKRGRKRS